MIPDHGRVQCSLCHRGQPYAFDRTRTEEGIWRITNNPLAWGSSNPEVIVLGFSKGPTQAGALATQPHNMIAYRGGRANLRKILHHIGLPPSADSALVDNAIADQHGRFHFASLVRCTVERFDGPRNEWLGTGGDMLDKFVASDFGQTVTGNCARQFVADLPKATKLIVMLGLGTKGNYVEACRKVYAKARPGTWRSVNEVAYTDDRVTVVHTEHFASQGALLPNWLSGDMHPRGHLGMLAAAATSTAMR